MSDSKVSIGTVLQLSLGVDLVNTDRYIAAQDFDLEQEAQELGFSLNDPIEEFHTSDKIAKLTRSLYSKKLIAPLNLQ